MRSEPTASVSAEMVEAAVADRVSSLSFVAESFRATLSTETLSYCKHLLRLLIAGEKKLGRNTSKKEKFTQVRVECRSLALCLDHLASMNH